MHPINEQFLTWTLLISVIYRMKDNVYDVVATNSSQFTHNCKNKLFGFISFVLTSYFYGSYATRKIFEPVLTLKS